MTQTTLSAAVTATDDNLTLASGTGVTALGAFGQHTTILYIEEEAIAVRSITSPFSTTNPQIIRGVGNTKIQAHVIGTRVLVATGTEAAPKLVSPQQFHGLVRQGALVSTLSTAGALTLTAAQVLGGLLLRDPNGAARTDTLPTAALLVAAMPDAILGAAFEFTIRNTADAAETITVAAGTGGTMTGTATIAQSNTKRFMVVLTNVIGGSETYDCHSLGTVVH